MENQTPPSSVKPKISFSRLDKFAQCPRQYEWIYVLGNERPDSPVLSYGRNVHKLIELMIREVLLDGSGGKIDVDPMEIDAWFEDKRKSLGLEPHEKWRLHKIAEFLTDKEFTLTDIEDEFFIELPEAILTGKPDFRCLDKQGVLIILDWKSGRRSFTREEVIDSLQLKIYAWYLIRKYAMETLRGQWYWREGGHTDPLVPWEEADFETELNGLVHELVSATAFPPKINSNCGYCPIKMTCPVKDDIDLFTYGSCKDRAKLWEARAKELRPMVDSKMAQIFEIEKLETSETGIPLETISYIEDGIRYVLSMGTEKIVDKDALFLQFIPAMDGIINLLEEYGHSLAEKGTSFVEGLLAIEQLKSLPEQLNVLKQIVEPVKKKAKEAGVVLPVKEETPSTKLTYSNVNKPKKEKANE